MDPLVVVSPHLDDAVLSCGQLMAGRPDVVVVTVFAGTPARHRMLTTYDQACGYHHASHAMRDRRYDDARALDLLRADPRHLRFLDHQYREVDVDPDPTPAEIADELETVIGGLTGLSIVLGPLGLAHPDHLLAADAVAALLARRPDLEGWVYEDQPSRVLWPEQVGPRLDRWRDRGFDPRLGFVGTGELDVKERAIGCYRSQLESLRLACGGNLYPVLVPERHHRLWRQPCE